MGKKQLTRQDVITTWKKLDRESEKPVGQKTLCTKMGIKPYYVHKLFQGENLTEVKLRHGIRTTQQETPYTPDQLLRKYDAVVSKLRHIPPWSKINFLANIPESTFKRKFGNVKRDVVMAYQKWLKKHNPKSRNLKVVDKWLKGENQTAVSHAPTTKTSRRKPRVYEKADGRTYGAPLSFRNLIYAPTNEQGVVFLFGMLSEELGFSVEGVWNDFPDCEAKRFVAQRHQQQPVKIEFELKSREFETHGHDPEKCDLIVCWKHNWKDCPIEVLELSEEIKNLTPTKK